jgi:gamma-glutamylcyclotransferase (GGCT)/AIG2-like uncharacterized protein YtfP
MQSLYFAYGSNLCSERLRSRVGTARALGPARLPGRRLCMNKRGGDGSGKANLRPDEGSEVWGVVYALGTDGWPALDACEAGYTRVAVEVLSALESLRVDTYLSERLTLDPVPFDWYKRLIVEGAREHGLPAEWVRLLESLPERSAAELS